MTKATVIIRCKADREKIKKWVDAVPDLSRVTFAKPRRSVPQSDKMWAMVTEVAEQRPVHCGLPMDPVKWKAVFMQGLGSEMVMMPTIDGQNWFPMGFRSSELDREEMANLIDYIDAWATQNGVQLSNVRE